MSEPSKMQVILDRAEAQWKVGKVDDAFAAIIEAIKLLSRAEQQNMHSLSRLQNEQLYRTDIPIT